VVEGIGDHGCEYMTGGVAVVLGEFGKNFGAGMSGGVAYLLDEKGSFGQLHNPEMIRGTAVTDPEDVNQLKNLVTEHLEHTGSLRAQAILADWDVWLPKFVRVSSKAEPVEVPPEEEVVAEVAG
jgi:glutamate synthase (NADPH/NADH) large chain/glutamate synthase (ferredoxin)